MGLIAFEQRFRWLARQGLMLSAESSPPTLCEIPITDPLSILQPADHLLCQGVGDLADKLIEAAGRGPWCHVAGYLGDGYIGEEMQGCGGQKLKFDAWRASRGDRIDIFRPVAPGYSAAGACDWFQSNVIGAPYDWRTIARFTAEHLAPLTSPVNHNEDDPPPTVWVCSTSWACADKQGGGVHPVRGLALDETQPSDSARSWIVQYVGSFQGLKT